MKRQEPSKKGYHTFLKYSGLGFQMLAAILLGAWLGGLIDDYFQNKTPYATAGMLMLMLFASFFQFIREITRDNK